METVTRQEADNPTWGTFRERVRLNVEESYPDQAAAIMKRFDEFLYKYSGGNPEATPKILLGELNAGKIKEIHPTIAAQIRNALEYDEHENLLVLRLSCAVAGGICALAALVFALICWW